ncbi:hypothetical protein L5515_018777 [Caenorhabditis briggsae]|uniref:Uncharacterized protein n=1 Tax=Caenorhabditis briggsae TaxID=6238 RepID=A0AAE9FHC0_CAEBR|nr:hypothetical protein L5515_018777 [Caenorhabditis briggsae]
MLSVGVNGVETSIECLGHPQATPGGDHSQSNMHPSWIIGAIAIIFIAHPATSIKCFVGPIDTLKMGEFVACVKVFIAETKQSWYEGSNTTFLEFNKICHVTVS